MSDVSVSVVAAAHAAREEFQERVTKALRDALATFGPSPFRLDVSVDNLEVTRMEDVTRTYAYRLRVRAEINDGF